MNTFFKHLFNPKIKIMDKITFMISLYAFYNSFTTPKDKARAEEIKNAIDAESLKLVPTAIKAEVKAAVETGKKPDVKLSQTVVDAKAKAAEALKEAEVSKLKAEEKAAESIAEETPAEKVAEEEKDEKVYDILPFYPCRIKTENGKFFDVPKPPKSFTIAEDEETQVKINNAYPTVEEFDMIMDEAWELACKGMSAKDLNVFLKKNLSGWYSETLKSETDYYSKLSNPICTAVGMIKKAFGQHPKDINVLITRPDGYESGKPGVPSVLTAKTDMTILAKVEEKKPVVEAKAELKTVQTAKPAAVASKPAAKEVIDEEAQETASEEVAETEQADAPAEEVVEESVTEDAVADDDNTPPAVNVFAKFSAIENSVAEKFIEGEKLAALAKTDDEKKNIKANKREEARSLIQSWFDGKTWVENNEDGKWNFKLIAYHNDLLKQIQSNRANWPK
jgi:hypothetical protein